MPLFKINVVPEVDSVTYDIEAETLEDAIDVAQDKFFEGANPEIGIREIEVLNG